MVPHRTRPGSPELPDHADGFVGPARSDPEDGSPFFGSLPKDPSGRAERVAAYFPLLPLAHGLWLPSGPLKSFFGRYFRVRSRLQSHPTTGSAFKNGS